MFSKEKEYVPFQDGCQCVGHVRFDFEVFWAKGAILEQFLKVEWDSQDGLGHVKSQSLVGCEGQIPVYLLSVPGS